MLSATRTPKRNYRRHALRAALFVTVPALVIALGATGRPQARAHASDEAGNVPSELGIAPAATAEPGAADVSAPACSGSSCPLPRSLSPAALAPPVFDALDFFEESGSVHSFLYSRVCGLSMNAPRTVIVIEGPMSQAIVEGTNLEPLYRQIQKREIGALKAESLENGETYCVPVVPLPKLMELSKEKLASFPEPPPAPEHADADPGAPFIGRVRVVLNTPYFFDGRSGAYVAEGGGK
jgi:hypothetical protein